jgi:hypothetical protein
MLEDFANNLHLSTQLLSRGTAMVMGHEVEAVKVRNLYGQEVVWGEFNCNRGKFKGNRITNDATTEGVEYVD